MKKGWKTWMAAAVLVVGATAFAACGGSSSSTTTAAGGGGATTGGGGGGKTVVISSDLPLQGASHDASTDTNNAIKLILEKAGNKAGNFTVQLKEYDNATAAKGGWDDATCAANAKAHVENADEVAVMGTYNSGCAKIEIPVLNQAPGGAMLMISHANTNPGITKPWEPGEPDKYYPTGKRNYGRIIATDDYQGTADAQFASQDLKVKRCYVLNDAQTYGVGVAKAFVDAAKKVGITVLANEPWDAKQPNYTSTMEKIKGQNPDCIFLGGINDNNGQQVIKDKVKVLGPNDGPVKLITPDGFTGYPALQKANETAGMYISFAGLPAGELLKGGGTAATFVADFKKKYGHDPASAYAIYGAAAYQLLMACVAASDGTRQNVLDKCFSGTVKVPADQSVTGKELAIDPKTGDSTVIDMSIQIMENHAEKFLKPWPITK